MAMYENPAEVIGERIRLFRDARGLTVKALAKIAGLTHPTVLRIEAGAGGRLESFAGIARALGMTLSELIGEPAPNLDVEIPGWSALSEPHRRALRDFVAAMAARDRRQPALRVADDPIPYSVMEADVVSAFVKAGVPRAEAKRAIEGLRPTDGDPGAQNQPASRPPRRQARQARSGG